MTESRSYDVLVIGQGYVGLPLAMLSTSLYRVAGVEIDSARFAQISSGSSPIPDVPSSQLHLLLSSGQYSVLSSLDQVLSFKIAVITVPTPLREGHPDLSYIEIAARSLAGKITAGALVILESTTYPGTTLELLVPLLESESGLRAGVDFMVGYSPERIDPGNSLWNLSNTPKVTSGIDQSSASAVENFYSSLGIPTVPVSGTREAEMTKLLENTFRHVNIALVNELAMFSENLGVDIWEAIEAASTKPFGFMPFTPGPGVGGHCLPVDPSYLSWAIKRETGQSFRFVELANKINSHMPNFVVAKVGFLLKQQRIPLEGSRILLLGLAYKAHTSDTRESPSLAIAEILTGQGAAVYAMDDYVHDANWPDGIGRYSNGMSNFDAGILVTAHENSLSDHLLGLCRVFLDTRNVMAGPNVHKL